LLAAQEKEPAAGGSPLPGNREEDPYLELRKSENRITQLTAERYFNLVKLQEWSDAAGKSTVMAKYVAHDPDLGWVKLQVARGHGKDRTVKEISVPVEKLSKQCQSRVRQISRLQPKLDELITAEAEADNAQEQPGDSLSSSEESTAEAGESLDPRQLGNFGIGSEVPNEQKPIEPGTPPEAKENSGPPPVDRTQWRTSYEAFRENLSVSSGQEQGEQIDWGELHELREQSDAMQGMTSIPPDDPSRVVMQQFADAAAAKIGEITWELPFQGTSEGSPDRTLLFDLQPPLPPPLQIQFQLADQQEADRWAQLRPGHAVRFSGPMKLSAPHSIVVSVKMSEEEPKSQPSEPAETQPPATEK
jgi:hypothetical protein